MPDYPADMSGVCLCSERNEDQASADFKGTLH